MGTGEAGVYYTSGGSNRVHHQALIHSIDGVFTHDLRTGRPRKMRSGGHGQANIDLLTQYGFTFHIDKVYPNGVRRGRVTGHAAKRKRDRAEQMWFPSQWSVEDIVKAGEYVSGLKSNRHKPEGIILWGTYKGVRVGIIKCNGQIQTIFPFLNRKPPQDERKAMNMDIRRSIKQRADTVDEDDIMVERSWKDMVAACVSDVPDTIKFIDTQCSADELSWLSEVFDELVEQTQNPELILSLRNAIIRNPEEDKHYYLMNNLDEAVDAYGDYAVKSAYRQAKDGISL